MKLLVTNYSIDEQSPNFVPITVDIELLQLYADGRKFQDSGHRRSHLGSGQTNISWRLVFDVNNIRR